MASRRKYLVFKKGGAQNESVKIFEKIVKSKYKTPIECSVKRGDFIAKTELSEASIIKMFPEWKIKHQTEKRTILVKE